MIAFLHTSPVHVATFQRLAARLDERIPIRHEVQEGLLADALALGAAVDAVRLATTEAVQRLGRNGARVIVCTCSTIGGVAEAVPVPAHIRVMRIDRPMAEQAVASGRRILVVAALRSTFAPTTTLLGQVAAEANRSMQVVEVFCERAWPLFETSDHSGYVREIVRSIEVVATPSDLILLAQASMAPATQRLGHLGIPVLSSPTSGVEAAVAMYRAMTP